MLSVSQFYLTFLKKEKASQNDSYSFYFSRSSAFDFLAGQYLKMVIDIPSRMQDERGNSRYFTIASSPTEKDYIIITTRIIKSAFKMTLANLVPGTKVFCSGPYGNFVFDENDRRPRVFLAGGIGITPARSMIMYLRDKYSTISMTIIVSFRLVDDILYYDELKKVEAHLKNFKYVITITKPNESHSTWNDETGRITKDIIRKYLKNPHDFYYYIVGPSAMVSSLYDLMKQMGVTIDNIKTENFPGY